MVFDDIEPAQRLTATYPLRIAKVVETIYGEKHAKYVQAWRGNTIVDISPAGRWLAMFQRHKLTSEVVP